MAVAPPQSRVPFEQVAAPPSTVTAPGSPWPRRIGWAFALVAVVAIGLMWLTPGFPQKWVIDVTKWFDSFRDWAITNEDTSPLFVYFLDPIGSFASTVVENTILVLERMTWLGLVVTAAAISGLVAGWRMALLAGAGVFSFGLLGVWDAAIETMALMLVAVILALAIGIPVGIWAGRRARVERVLRPILDAMQTIPAYSYLLPFVLLFGIGDAPALLATLAFAIPPAIRLTALGIRLVPATSLEVADAFGATDRQRLRMVQVPLAKPSIMLGVNQTIMMALGIVVIAAFVGAGGLGQTVLDGLQRLSVGSALEGGIAIVIMAIVLDRVTTAWSVRERRRVKPPHIGDHVFSRRQLGLVAIAAIVLAVIIGRQVLRQQGFPEGLEFSLAGPADSFVDWMQATFGSFTQKY